VDYEDLPQGSALMNDRPYAQRWEIDGQRVKVMYAVGTAITEDIAEALLWRKWYPSLGLRWVVIAVSA
jgi:hypothetical protein